MFRSISFFFNLLSVSVFIVFNQYNIKNTIRLVEDLTKLKINEHHKMVTYDIKNLCLNIPIKETLMITKSILLKHIDTQVTKQIITLLETILQQIIFYLLTIYINRKKASPWDPTFPIQ